MALNEDSTLGEILKSEAATAVMEKHLPGFTTKPGIEMAAGFTLKTVQTFPQSNMSKEVLKVIVADLAKI